MKASSSVSSLSIPSSNELEVSLFGPGVGECVVLHIGNGEWAVVDSCVDPDTGQPVALTYLKDLGLDPASAVKVVVVTHWHDDHVRGTSQIIDECPDATFVCSAALKRDEFLQLAAAANRAAEFSRGASELGKILSRLKERVKSRGRGIGGAFKLATEHQLLHRSSVGTEIWSLSPSAYSQSVAAQSIARLLPKRLQPFHDVLPTANELAVVLWVKWRDTAVLLGADLEEGSSPNGGWQAIVSSKLRPPGKADIFKVPHHGSENADSVSVWSQMLRNQPVAVLTPYAAGRKPLPTNDDITRLAGRTVHLYGTKKPGNWKPPKRLPAVDKTIREVALDHRVTTDVVGHVRIRLQPDETLASGGVVDISLMNGAIRLGKTG